MKIRFVGYSTGEISCINYTLRIYDELYVGNTPEATFNIEAPGFERSIEPQTELVAAFGVMPSAVNFNLQVSEGDAVINNWLRNQLPLAQENRFHLEILKGTDIYYRGTLLTDGLEIPDDCGEYAARLTFSDGLSFLQGFTNYPPLGLGRLRDARVITFIQGILLNIPAINLWNDSEDFIRTHVRWYDALNARADDPLFENHLLPDGVLYNVDENSETAVESVSLLDQLNILSKTFNCRIVQEGGVWWVLQVDAYREPEMLVYAYNRKTPFVGTSLDETRIKNANGALDYGTDISTNDVALPFFGSSANITFLPALKSAVITLEDENRFIGETLRQAVRSIANTTINPDQPLNRDQTWFPVGLLQIVPDASVRIFGRARFWELSNVIIPNLVRTPYMRIELRINGTGITAFASAQVTGPTQTFNNVSLASGQLPYRYEFVLEFDASLNQLIPAGGTLEFRIVDEGTLETSPGYITPFMDIRLSAEYVGVNGINQAIKLDYEAKNSRSGIKSSAIFSYSTPLGDVLTSPTVNPNGYLNKGALFVPSNNYPFRLFCGRWRINNEPPDLPILSLLAKRIVEFQNQPLYQLDGDLLGDAWGIWDFLTYKGRRYIFNGGNFISDAETWTLRLVEITTINNNVTVDPVYVREPSRQTSTTTGPLTIPSLDVVRGKNAAVAETYESGELVEFVRINTGDLGNLPSGGNLVFVDPANGNIESVPIAGMPTAVEGLEGVVQYEVNHTFNSQILVNSLVFFDANADASLLPQLQNDGVGVGALRGVNVSVESGATVLRFTPADASQEIVVNLSAAGDKNYVHTQSAAFEVWQINHNLGKFPSVQCFDSAGNSLYGNVNHININNLEVSFSNGRIGTAICN